MIVVDVETTGTNPMKHSLASIGAVDFVNPADQFYEECRVWGGAHIDDEALIINGYKREELQSPQKQSEGDLIQRFLKWIESRQEHTIGGQNPFFDVSFIQAACGRNHLNFTLAHRTVDLHSITYFHMIGRGINPPVEHKRSNLNSDTIMAYVGIPAEPKPHIALNGAIWEAEAFSRLFCEQNLFPQFKRYSIPWV